MKASLQTRSIRKPVPKNRGKSCAGFTLIELMIVVSIILILIGMAAVNYRFVIVRAKEATLKADLRCMREAIDNFTLDKQAAPQSLEDLHQAGYLRDVPADPMTQAKDWMPQFDNTIFPLDQPSTGIVDLHSSSEGTSPFNNTRYNEW